MPECWCPYLLILIAPLLFLLPKLIGGSGCYTSLTGNTSSLWFIRTWKVVLVPKTQTSWHKILIISIGKPVSSINLLSSGFDEGCGKFYTETAAINSILKVRHLPLTVCLRLFKLCVTLGIYDDWYREAYGMGNVLCYAYICPVGGKEFHYVVVDQSTSCIDSLSGVKLCLRFCINVACLVYVHFLVYFQ